MPQERQARRARADPVASIPWGVPVSIPLRPEDAFFLPIDGENGRGFEATELTRGPWDPRSQHAGPPLALLARACEGLPREDGAEMRVARITSEILRPIPLGRFEVAARTVRPGRSVDLIEAELRHEGEPIVRTLAWRMRAGSVELPDGLGTTSPGSPAASRERPSGLAGPPPAPEDCPGDPEFFPIEWDPGYHTAMEVRFMVGGYNEAGPAAAWMRSRVSLVAGEEPSPLQRVMIAADSGNGISSTLDFRRFLFINVDLTVYLVREPTDEWIGLDAMTVPEATGVGLSDTVLLDRRGPIGRANQALLVAQRG